MLRSKILCFTIMVLVTLLVTHDAFAQKLYWAEKGPDKIRRADLDGSNPEDILTGLNNPWDVAIDAAAGKLYWVEDTVVRRANLDGSSMETLYSGGKGLRSVALDLTKGKVYWTDIMADSIYKAKLNGSDVKLVIKTGPANGGPLGLALDPVAGKVYWTDAGAKAIRRCNRNGSNMEHVVTSPGPAGIELDLTEGKIYWSDTANNHIHRSNLDGSNVEHLVTSGLNNPWGLTVSPLINKIYFTDDTNEIYRANLDGSSVQTLVSTGIFPFGLDVSGYPENTWYVPDDFTLIQDALSDPNVVNGDTIIVRPGKYEENLDFLGKGVTLKSENGPMATLIAGNQAGSVVTFQSSDGPDPVLEGFTVTNGKAAYGAGVLCLDYSSPHIMNNIITENEGGTYGGGIFCAEFSSPLIINNILSGNSSDSGGAIGCNGSDPIITNNTITGNTADTAGGGFFGYNTSSPIITNTIFWNNTAPSDPEIHMSGGSPTVTYCDVKGGFAGTGNMDKDPRFMDPNAGDYHLFVVSPCINAGSNLAPHLPALDLDGDPRVVHQVVDMGVDEATYTLLANTKMISASQGKIVEFDLLAGQENAFRNYLLLGNLSGTAPGTPLPGGLVTLPLNWDTFTNIVIAFLNTPPFQNFMGPLSLEGSAHASFDTLGPLPHSTVGLVLNFAYALNNRWDFVSNPVGVEIVP